MPIEWVITWAATILLLFWTAQSALNKLPGTDIRGPWGLAAWNTEGKVWDFFIWKFPRILRWLGILTAAALLVTGFKASAQVWVILSGILMGTALLSVYVIRDIQHYVPKEERLLRTYLQSLMRWI